MVADSTTAEFDTFARDLAAFGTNMLELSHIGAAPDLAQLAAFSDACAPPVLAPRACRRVETLAAGFASAGTKTSVCCLASQHG